MQRKRASGRECGPNTPGVFHTLVRLVVASDHVAVLLAPRVNLEKEWEQLSLGMKKRKKNTEIRKSPMGSNWQRHLRAHTDSSMYLGREMKLNLWGMTQKLTNFLLFCSFIPARIRATELSLGEEPRSHLFVDVLQHLGAQRERHLPNEQTKLQVRGKPVGRKKVMGRERSRLLPVFQLPLVQKGFCNPSVSLRGRLQQQLTTQARGRIFHPLKPSSPNPTPC